MKKIVLVLIVLFFLVGCSAHNQKVTQVYQEPYGLMVVKLREMGITESQIKYLIVESASHFDKLLAEIGLTEFQIQDLEIYVGSGGKY